MRSSGMLLSLLLLTGCGVFEGAAVRALGNREKEALDKLSQRLAENQKPLRAAASQLDALTAEYARIEFQEELALSKAKLLESMRSPWADPSPGIAETQRAVVLYHLYELELSQLKALDARIEARISAEKELTKAGRELQRLVEKAADNLALVLRHLNQPRSARIRAFTETFLAEVSAFRGQLSQSDNPHLRAIAERVQHYEQRAQEAKTRIDRLLDVFLKSKEQ